jgi:hypothetical protein
LNWIRNLKQINTEQLMDEFILLFSALNEVRLNDDRHHLMEMDEIRRLLGSLSAYDAQFLGAFPAFRASTIWKAFTEPMCCFFAWLALQGKAPTADNLMKKN